MNKMFDRYASVIFLAIGAMVVVGSMKISTSSYGSSVGSNAFPLGLGIVLILLSIRNFYETLRLKFEKKETPKLEYKRFIIILVSAVIYIFILEPVGYVISTFLFLVVGFQFMDSKGLLKSIMISAGLSIAIYYLYVKIMNGTLPALPEWLGGF